MSLLQILAALKPSQTPEMPFGRHKVQVREIKQEFRRFSRVSVRVKISETC
jgi:hypothetical protein